MKDFLDSDPKMINPANAITGEIHENILANTSIALNHDIYFSDTLIIVETENSSPLLPGTDYTFEEKDKTALSLSGKGCYQKVRFLKDFPSITASYHAYGDFFKADHINSLVNGVTDVKDYIDNPPDDSVTDDMIGSRTLQDEEANYNLLPVAPPKKLTGWLQGILNNIKALFANITDLVTKYQALKGYGGFLEPHNFGSATPSQQDLSDYALQEIGISNPLDIFNGTHVKNIWVNPDTTANPNQVPDNNVWVLTNTINTIPPVFEWINDGPSGISNASNVRYGVLKGVSDPGNNSKDGYLTIDEAGSPKVLGFNLIHSKQNKLPAGATNVLLGPATEGGEPGTKALDSFIRKDSAVSDLPNGASYTSLHEYIQGEDCPYFGYYQVNKTWNWTDSPWGISNYYNIFILSRKLGGVSNIIALPAGFSTSNSPISNYDMGMELGCDRPEGIVWSRNIMLDSLSSDNKSNINTLSQTWNGNEYTTLASLIIARKADTPINMGRSASYISGRYYISYSFTDLPVTASPSANRWIVDISMQSTFGNILLRPMQGNGTALYTGYFNGTDISWRKIDFLSLSQQADRYRFGTGYYSSTTPVAGFNIDLSEIQKDSSYTYCLGTVKLYAFNNGSAIQRNISFNFLIMSHTTETYRRQYYSYRDGTLGLTQQAGIYYNEEGAINLWIPFSSTGVVIKIELDITKISGSAASRDPFTNAPPITTPTESPYENAPWKAPLATISPELVNTKQNKIPTGSSNVLLGPATDGAHPGTKPLGDFLLKGVANDNKANTTALIIEPTNDNNYNEGIRLNFAPNLWSGIVMGGSPGSTGAVHGYGYAANQNDPATRRSSWFIASTGSGGDLILAQSSAGKPATPYGLCIKRDGTVYIGYDGVSAEGNQVLTQKVVEDTNIRLYSADLGLPTVNESTATTKPFYQTGKSLTLTISPKLKLATLNGWVMVGNAFTGGYNTSQVAIPNIYLPKAAKQGYLMFNIGLDNPAATSYIAPKLITGYLGCPAGDSGTSSIVLRFGPAGSMEAGQYNEAFFDTTWCYG